MKVYKLRSEDGFFGLAVTMYIKQTKDQEDYCVGIMRYFHYRNPNLLATASTYLQYFNFICKAILSICFKEYNSKGSTPSSKQILKELEYKELIDIDDSLNLEISNVPLLANIHFDLAASLKEFN